MKADGVKLRRHLDESRAVTIRQGAGVCQRQPGEAAVHLTGQSLQPVHGMGVAEPYRVMQRANSHRRLAAALGRLHSLAGRIDGTQGVGARGPGPRPGQCEFRREQRRLQPMA